MLAGYHFEIHSLWYLGMIPWIGACFTAYFGGQMSDWLRKRLVAYVSHVHTLRLQA